MGLFIIGKNQKLLNLQKLLVINSPNKLMYTESQLLNMANKNVERELQMINESADLVNHTVNPDVFFSRLEFIKERLNYLIALQPYVKYKGKTPSHELSKINNMEQGQIKLFLTRYFDNTTEKANGMKTDKGKKNKYKKFYDSLQKYYSNMNQENIAFVESKKHLFM